jgi:signal peptidase I
MKTRAVLAFAGSVFFSGLAFAEPDGDRLLFRERTSFLGQGTSMLPTLPESCRLAVVRVPFAKVKVGLLDGDVITTRLNGRKVTHRAVRHLVDGSIVTWGDNNPAPDRVVTTEANYVGVITSFEDPATPGVAAIPARRSPRS